MSSANDTRASKETTLRLAEALHEAVSSIYFDDASKYRSALGCVVRHLDPDMASTLLMDPKKAFDATQQAVDAANEALSALDFDFLAENPAPRPNARDVGRVGDMSPSAHLRVGLDNDNDVYVSVWDGRQGGDIEFCTQGMGGGKSPRTREALIALMVAIEADNAETPSFDWWARRGARSNKGEE